MKIFINRIKQWIHQKKVKDKCIFEDGVIIDSRDRFGGCNRLTSNVVFLNSEIGYASYIGNRSIIKNTKIGKYCCIATDVHTLSGIHPTEKFVSIHPAFYSTRKQSGFTFVDRDSFYDFCYLDPEKQISVEIGNDVWIGASVLIREGIRIGDGAVIAAGSVITKDVPPYAIVGGVPAKIIKYRFDTPTIEKLLRIRWWDRDGTWLQTHAFMFDDVESFIAQIDDCWIQQEGTK